MDDKTLPTPEEAMKFMDSIIHDARTVLAEVLQDDINHDAGTAIMPEERAQYAMYPKHCPDIELAKVGGAYCGHAQTLIKSTLKNMGQEVQCYTVQSIEDKAAFNHVALSVELETTEGTKRYLVDPTFAQFCTGDEQCPGELLGNMPEGEYMIDRLKSEGFVELTEERATNYISAFCRGINPFPEQGGVMNYFENPTDIRSTLMWPPESFFTEKCWLKEPEETRPIAESKALIQKSSTKFKI